VQRIFIIAFPLFLLLFSSISCSENHKKPTGFFQKIENITPPLIVPAGNPFVVRLDTCPAPQIITIPTKDSSFLNFKTAYWERRLKMVPPVIQPADFFVTMPKFSNEQGLEAHSVFSSLEDKNGNLWFGTHGGGVTRYNGKSAVTFTDLKCNDVRAFAEDTEGNIWLGMGGCGLIKYDGRAMISYTTTQGLIHDEIRALAIDQKGNIWIGTDGKGVSCFDGKSFTNFSTTSGLANNWIRSIALDKKGNIWFGTNGGGASCYDGKTFRSVTMADGLINNFVRSIACDKKGNIWFGTGNGVTRYDGNSFINFTMSDGLVSNNISFIKEDGNGNIWMGSYGGGVSRYDGHSFENFTKKQGLASDYIMTITNDKNGNLWFGAEGGGVTCYEGAAVTNFSTEQGLLNHYIVSITEDKKGNLWFGPNSGGVCRYDGKSFTNFTWYQGFSQNRVNAIYQDKNENIWFCTSSGFSRFDGIGFTNYNKFHGIRNDEVRCVMEDSVGNLWFGIENGGIAKFDGRTMTSYTTAQGLPNNNVRAIINDSAGNFWIGTFGGGLSRFDGKSFINFDTAQGMAENRVLSMKKDSKGNLWIGSSYNGVSILRKEIMDKIGKQSSVLPKKLFEKFTTQEGLANNVVYDIVEDKDQNIFIGTNFGLTVIKKGLTTGKEIATADIEYYNQKTGFAIPDMNGQAMFADSKGMIWGGTGHDLIRFNYAAVRKSPDPPHVAIQGIKINNEEPGWYNLLFARKPLAKSSRSYMLSAIETEENLFYGPPRSETLLDSMRKKYECIIFDSIARFFPVPLNLTIPHRYNNITIEFGANETARPYMVRYQYKLEGYDREWSPVTEKPFADFGNIYEGKYHFKVKAMSPEGVWSKPVSFSFTVLPPYWRSWWFKLIYITGFVALLFFVIKWRIDVVRRNEQKKLAYEKELLEMEARALRAQMNPHFIFNCLNSIKALMQQQETERGVTYLTTFSKLIRTLFHNSDKRQISLHDEIETCKLYTQLEAMRLNGKLSYNFNIDPNLDLKSVMVPALIIQPFIENAIWHGIVPKNEGTINISVTGNEDLIICEVNDNGIGRERSKLNRPITPVIHESKGVHLSQQRLNVEKILNDTNASIEIIDKYENDLPAGTKVILTFYLN
jgi:ligand-binding sensor domain-containing protein/two-component sensor histidine kinase